MSREFDPRRTTGTLAKIENQVSNTLGDLLPKELKKKLEKRRLIRHFEELVGDCRRRDNFPILPREGKLHECEEGISAVFHPLIAELTEEENKTLQQVLADFPEAYQLDYEVSYSKQTGDDVDYTFKPLIATAEQARKILQRIQNISGEEGRKK